jgi:trehalose/maltose hydrolase-like predicted phosphorylase
VHGRQRLPRHPGSGAGEHGPRTALPRYVRAGVYNRATDEVAGRLIHNESLVNLPNWLVLTFRIDGGDWFLIDDVDVLEHEQALDLRRAVLTRRTRFRDGAGRTTMLTQRRFVSMASEHVCALETTIVAEDWSGGVEIRSALDGTVENTLVERYRDLASRHLRSVRTREIGPDVVLLDCETSQSRVRIGMAARTRLCRDGEPADAARRLVEREDWIGHDLVVDVHEGQPLTVEKLVTVFTSRDRAISEPAEEAARWIARLGGFDTLLADHVKAWTHLWDRFHFHLEGGAETLPVLRLHVLHLLQTVSPNTVDLDVGVPPRGLHGEAYRGHILWDELFVLPLLNLRVPGDSRALLRYRYRRLPEASQAAVEAGYAGAMYPWQSGSDGREESQQLHLNPMSGRWIPTRRSGSATSGSPSPTTSGSTTRPPATASSSCDYGAELLLEIALLVEHRQYDRSRDRYVIRGVMGPDEFHSATRMRRPRRDRQQRLHQRHGGVGAAAGGTTPSTCCRPGPARAARDPRASAPTSSSGGTRSRRRCSSRSTTASSASSRATSTSRSSTGSATGSGTGTSSGSTASSRPRTTTSTGTRPPSRPTC